MDIIKGVPALLDSDPASTMGQYSRDLRTLLHQLVQGGTADINMGGSSQADVTITFPVAFTGTGSVVVAPSYIGTATSPFLIPSVVSVNNAGATLRFRTVDGSTHAGTRTIGWIAYKVRA